MEFFMDQYAVSIILLDETALIGLALLLVISGGIAAAFLFNVEIFFRRITYLWAIALLGLALSFSQTLWALTPAAANAGTLWLLVAGTMGAFVVFGMGVYAASAARSRHICGDTSYAALGFVPFANLWLMFKRGQGAPASPARSRVSRFLLDPALVVGAICVLAFTQVLDRALRDAPAYSMAGSAALSSLIAETHTLEESLALEAQLSGPHLPVRIDDVTLMSGIEAQGGTLTISFDVERDMSGFRSGFKETLVEMQRTPEMFGHEISRGATIEMIYRAPDDKIIESYAITEANCSS